jgi:hypothetical protein
MFAASILFHRNHLHAARVSPPCSTRYTLARYQYAFQSRSFANQWIQIPRSKN